MARHHQAQQVHPDGVRQTPFIQGHIQEAHTILMDIQHRKTPIQNQRHDFKTWIITQQDRHPLPPQPHEGKQGLKHLPSCKGAQANTENKSHY